MDPCTTITQTGGRSVVDFRVEICSPTTMSVPIDNTSNMVIRECQHEEAENALYFGIWMMGVIISTLVM